MSQATPTLYVDGDACPVKAEAEAIVSRHQIQMVLVCNGGLRPSSNPLVRMVYVDQGLDVADRWIEEAVVPGDLIITSDIPLAAACVEKGGVVVKPDGEVLNARNVGAALATRDLMTDLREASPLSAGGGGGKPFSKADRSRFRNALERCVRQAKSAP